jgi:hypothetical protein
LLLQTAYITISDKYSDFPTSLLPHGEILMFRKSLLTAAVFISSGCSLVSGQDAVLEEFYGRGVHRFFANDYVQAYEQLNLAIENGSKDPRAFYFRGLAALASGRIEEAEADWRAGAAIEARGLYGNEIGRALARIQGTSRLDLERIRQSARLAALSENQLKSRARYAPSADMPAVPLRGAKPAPVAPAAPAVAADNPFADDPVPATGPAKVESTDALSGSLEAATPKPVTPAPAGEAVTPAPGGDVFEAPATGNDPFGGATTPPAGDDPFGGSGTPATDDDPFGN